MATMRQMSNMVVTNGDQTIDGVKTFSSSVIANNVNLNEGVNPPGTVIYVARSTAPAGYIKANGATVSRSTYATLFSAIGTVFGAGDGSTTFVLPDLRGEFVRGWDDARGVDTNRGLGSTQAAALLNHTHSGTTSSNGSHSHTFSFKTSPLSYVWNVSTVANANGFNQSGTTTTNTEPSHTHTLTTGNPSAGGGTETRPRNVSLLACIKT